MTFQLTDEEEKYYQACLSQAVKIATTPFDDAYSIDIQPLIAVVFEKIASHLHYLHEKPPKVDKVQEHNTGIGQKTRFKPSKAPDKDGFTEFAREDYVKTDLGGVLQYLRAHPSARKRFKGYVYKLTDFDGRDWLWRQKEASK